jgi:hypothetical protein
MSEITIPVNADTTQAQAAMNKLTGQANSVDQTVKKTEFNLFRMYVYTSHLSALIARSVERGMRGTEAATQAMAWLQGIQFVNSQVAAASAAIQAKAAFAASNIPGGIMLSAAAVMMEYNAIQLYQQQRETAQLQAYLKNISRQFISWS